MAENKKIITVETLGAYTEEVKNYVGSQVSVKADKTTVEGLSTSVDGIAGDVADIKSSIGEIGESIEGINTELAKKASTEYVNAELDKKVDLEGYVAFTSEEKAKLAGIAEGANKFELPEGTVIDATYATRMSALESSASTVDSRIETAIAGEVLRADGKYELAGAETRAKGYADGLIASEVSRADGKYELAGAETRAKEYVDGKDSAMKNYVDGKDSTMKTYVDGKVEVIDQKFVTVNNAIEALTNGTSTEEIDSVMELVKYVEEHGTEVEGMKNATKAVADRATALEGRADALEAQGEDFEERIAELEAFELPSDLVHDANYKHITVTTNSVTDGSVTFSKYDDSTLRGEIAAETLRVNGEISRVEGLVSAEASRVDGLLANKADKTELNSYYTKTEADGKFLTAHQDISGKADKTYVDGLVETINGDIESLEGRMDTAEGALATVDSRISTAVSGEASRVDGLMAAETSRVNGELDKKLNISDLVYATTDDVKNLF